MKDFLAPALAYLAPSLYLFSIAFLSFRGKKSPERKAIFSVQEQGILAVMMLSSNIYFNGIFASLRALIVAFVLFLFLLVSRLLSRNGALSLPIALSSLPLMTWMAFSPGLLLVAIISAVRISRLAGVKYLKDLAIDTAVSMGVLEALNGNPSKVSITDLPIPTAEDKKRQDKIGDVHRSTINLFLYLGLSAAIFGIIAFLQ